MKKLIYTLLTVILLANMACQKKIDVEKETKTIKDLINNETQAYLQNDTSKALSYFINDDFQTHLNASCDGFRLLKGWEELSKNLKNRASTGFGDPRSTKDFFQIKVVGNTAWAIYKDNWTYVDYFADGGVVKDTVKAFYSICTMNLEKIENEWKISSFSSYSPGN